jgi:hypothetical protein
MGDSAMMVGLYKDQRTHEVTKGMATALKNTNGRLQRHSSNRPGAVQRPSQVRETEDYDGFYTPSEQAAGNDYGERKDYNGDSVSAEGTTDSGLHGDSQIQPSMPSFSEDPDFRQSHVRKRNSALDNKQVARPDQEFGNSSDTDFIFDDPSPAAGNDSDMQASSSISGDGSGSAWERVRRGQTRKTAQSQIASSSRQSAQGSRTGRSTSSWSRNANDTSADSFSFSASERDRQLAKELAHPDFDRMFEEERKGADGDATTGNRGAWSRRRGK